MRPPYDALGAVVSIFEVVCILVGLTFGIVAASVAAIVAAEFGWLCRVVGCSPDPSGLCVRCEEDA